LSGGEQDLPPDVSERRVHPARANRFQKTTKDFLAEPKGVWQISGMMLMQETA